MSLAEHSSKVSHVDDSLQDVSTLMTLVELKIHLVSFCWWMNFIQVDEWKRRLLQLVREKKMKSRRFTSYEQVTRLRLRMLQNWFTWQPVVPEQLGEVIRLRWHPGVPAPCCHKGSGLGDKYRTKKQLISKWLCPIWQSSNRNHEEWWRCITYFLEWQKGRAFAKSLFIHVHRIRV